MKTKALLLAMLLATTTTPAFALSVSPLVKTYTANETKGEITITNTAKEGSTTYQISVDRLTVENGVSVRKPSQNIRFAPSLVTVPAGKSQKVLFLRTPAQSTEEVYRINVRELKDPKKQGLQRLSAMDFPWIWRGLDVKPSITGRWEKDELVVTNSGQGTAQLTDLIAGSKQKKGLIGYVLPGETKRFKMPDMPRSQVSVKVNGTLQGLAQ